MLFLYATTQLCLMFLNSGRNLLSLRTLRFILHIIVYIYTDLPVYQVLYYYLFVKMSNSIFYFHMSNLIPHLDLILSRHTYSMFSYAQCVAFCPGLSLLRAAAAQDFPRLGSIK